MESEETKKARILEFSLKEFMANGFNQVTMDHIAHGIGMGKATVYRFFPSKEELLFSVIDYFSKKIEASFHSIIQNPEMTDVEKLRAFLKDVATRLSKIRPEIMAGMLRSVPEAYEKIETTRRRIIMENLMKLLEDGQKSGTYDSAINTKLAAYVLIGAVKEITQEQTLVSLDYNFNEIFRQVTKIIFKGCLTDECRSAI